MKKRYIEISNIGEINKSAIELLGFSDKRNRTDLIGEKGTGLKFSRLQCLRKSIDFWVTTSGFKNSFTKKKVDEENDQVIFKYESLNGKTHYKPSSYTVEAGFGDWTDDWFIVREVIQNAVDETKRNRLCGSRDESMEMVLKCSKIVDEVSFAKKGNTNIYIELTPEIEKVFSNLDKYFVYSPMFACEHGSLHKKKEEDKIKVYKQGIFVQEYSHDTGLYDVECSSLELQENRTPKHGGDVSDEVLKIYSEAPINIKRQFLRYCNYNKDSFELKWAWGFTSPLSNKDSWVKAFCEEFGEKAVIHHDTVIQEYVLEKAKMHKYTVIVLANPIYKFLKESIRTLEDLTSSFEGLQYHAEEPTGIQADILTEAMPLLHKIFSTRVPVKIYTPLTELEHNTAGVYLPRRKEILINKNNCTSLEAVLPVLIEEFIHAETGADDGSRAFQDFATNKISQLLLNK